MGKEMTSKEALKILENRNDKLHINHLIGSRRIADEEIKEIATVIDKLIKEVFRPLIERDTPAKIKHEKNGVAYCPICERSYLHSARGYENNFCGYCGQRLDWKESK